MYQVRYAHYRGDGVGGEDGSCTRLGVLATGEMGWGVRTGLARLGVLTTGKMGWGVRTGLVPG